MASKASQAMIDKRIMAWVSDKNTTAWISHLDGRGIWAADGYSMLKVEPHQLPNDAVPDVGRAKKYAIVEGGREWQTSETTAAEVFAVFLPGPGAADKDARDLELTDWRVDIDGDLAAMLHCKTFQVWINLKYLRLITTTLEVDVQNHAIRFCGKDWNQPVYVIYNHVPVATIMPMEVGKRGPWPVPPKKQS